MNWRKWKGGKNIFSWKIALLKVFIQHYWLTCSIFWIKCSNKKNSFSLQIEYFKHHWEPWWCVYTEWISCCRKTSPMMILSTQTLHFLSAWWKEGEKKKFFLVRMNGKKNFSFLFFLISISSFMSPSLHAVFRFRWTKVNF